ncbi:hypothetical protein Ancab_033768 [Ancistrocladus abbreviatus]
MGGANRASMNSAARIVSQRISKLSIPKRGQVKVAIVLGLSHTLAALCSLLSALAVVAATVLPPIFPSSANRAASLLSFLVSRWVLFGLFTTFTFVKVVAVFCPL